MSESTASSEWILDPGKIYQLELHKRVDDRPAETAASLQRADLEGSELVFASASMLDQALDDGVFLRPASTGTTVGAACGASALRAN